jgi:predicted transcriptional regulator
MSLTTYYNEDGEIFYSKQEVEERDQRARNQKEAYERLQRAEAYRNKDRDKKHVRIFAEGVNEVQKDLTLIDAGNLYKIMLNVQLNRGGVVEHGKDKPLKQKDMEALLGRSKPATIAAISRLEALGMIRKEKQGRANVYILNEDVIRVGKGGDKQFIKIFKDKAQKLLDVLTDSEAGLLLKLTPYIHFKTYTLASDPNEPDLKKVRVLNSIELAEQLGIDRDTFKKLSGKLAKKGVVMKYSVYGIKNGLFFNPYLCDRGYEAVAGNGEHNYKRSLCEQFDALEHNK